VVVTPTEQLPKVNLTPKEKEQIWNLAQAVKTDEKTSRKIIEQKIQEAVDKSSPEIKENITQPVISKYAVGLVETIKPLSEFKSSSEIPDTISVINTFSPIMPITNLDNPTLISMVPDAKIRQELIEKAKVLSVALDVENTLNHSLTSSLFGSENISEVIYPKATTTFQIAENQEDPNQKDNGIEINLSDIYDKGKKVLDVWQKLANGTTTTDEVATSITSVVASNISSAGLVAANEATLLLTSALPSTIGAITGFGGVVLATHMVTTDLPMFSMLVGPQIAGLFGSGGLQGIVAASSPIIAKNTFAIISNTGRFVFVTTTAETATGVPVFAIGAKLGQSAISVVASTTGIQIATSGIFAQIGAVLGFLGTPIVMAIGAAVGWVVGKIIEKIPWKKIGPWLLGGLAGIGAFMFAGPVAGIVVGLGTLGLTSAVAGGTGVTFGAIGSGIAGFFGAIGGAFLGSIWKPILAVLIGFPVLVALILFIVNSGAYVVPPGEGSLSNTNPYIDVQKIAEPSGGVPSPTTVTYTITITAKRDVLTNISLTNNCQAINKAGTKTDCKGLEQLPSPPDSIAPAQPFSFTFKSDYGGNFQDSLVTDNVTINAKSESGGNVSETGSASVCFGDCPLDCFQTVNNSEDWPSNLKANLNSAAATLASTYPNFAAKVCAAGTINLCYTTQDPNPVGVGGLCNGTIYARHIHTPDCDINFNQCGLQSQSDALYILTHESTHHIQSINGSYQQKFDDQVPQSEWALCSYGATSGDDAESMAEGDALFVGKPSWSNCITNYITQYPTHYLFAKNVMFAP